MWLGAWRRFRGLTQAELAATLGIQPSSLQKYEGGERPFQKHRAEALVGVLGEEFAAQRPGGVPAAEALANVLSGKPGWGVERLPSPPPTPAATLRDRQQHARLLAEALEQFQHMPADSLPPVAAVLPSGSRLPQGYGHNPFFVGRAGDREALARHLSDQGAAVAVVGLGGIGKTDLALDFVFRYGRYFAGGVYWLRFADPEAVEAEVADCGSPGRLNLASDYRKLPLDAQVALVREAWQDPMPRLLVFDNCEEEAVLRQWWPTSGGCRVLVTSRRLRWQHPRVRVHELAPLAPEESCALLRRYRSDLTAGNTDLRQIAEILGDLPLALHLAGSFLRRYRHDAFGQPDPYLLGLRALAKHDLSALLNHPSLTGEGVIATPADHVQHVAVTFARSYEALEAGDPTDALARALLARAAYFAPGEPIPRQTLLATTASAGNAPAVDDLTDANPAGDDLVAERQLDDEAAVDRRVADALGRLLDVGLLRQEEASGALRLHQLVAAFAHSVTPEVEAQAAQKAVEQALLEQVHAMNASGYPTALLPLQRQLRAVTDTAGGRGDERAAALSSVLGYHLHEVGDLVAARPYYERALAIHQSVLPPDHPDLARSLINLGMLLRDQGDLAGARPHLEQALAILEQAQPPDLPELATSLNNLGMLLHDLGDLAGARPYYERAVAIRQVALGPDHAHVATSLANLGLLLQDQGDFARARTYYERALAILERALPPDHPDLAHSLNNLGGLLWVQDDLAGARPYWERAVAIRRAALGLDHPDLARSLINLGTLLQKQGDLAGARPHLERALAILEQSLPPNHPDLATSLTKLGLLLREQGDPAGAQPQLERALAILEAAYGADDARTRVVRGNVQTLTNRHPPSGTVD